LGIIVTRKALSNSRILTSNSWSLLLVAALWLPRVRTLAPRAHPRTCHRREPSRRAAIAGALSAGVFGFFTEDTGVLVPAFIFVPVALCAVWLVVSATAAAGESAWRERSV